MSKNMWVEKYRPKKIDDVIFKNDAQKGKFKGYVVKKEIPNLLLSGVQGSGKTTISRALMRELNVDRSDIMVINGSEETGVDAMREKIRNFVTTMPIGDFRIVRIEEADYLSLNAQAALRVLIENFSSNARFILTCNYANKLTPPVKSRLTHHTFEEPDTDGVLIRLADIMVEEKREFEIEDIEKVVRIFYPDIRSCIMFLEDNTTSGKLVINDETNGNDDYKFKILELIAAGNFAELRKLIRTTVPKDEYEEVFRILYEGIKLNKKGEPAKIEEMLITLNDFVFKHGVVALPELNMEALLISLGRCG